MSENSDDKFRIDVQGDRVRQEGYEPPWTEYYGRSIELGIPLRFFPFLTLNIGGKEVATYVTFADRGTDRWLTSIVGYVWPTDG